MHLRPAIAADCADLVILDNIAGHGLPLSLWQDAVSGGKGTNALEVGREHYLDQDQPCNWTNATVAEVDGALAGAAVGYILPSDIQFPSTDNGVLAPLYRLFQRAAGGWVIDVLAVYSRFRRRGIARALLANQIAQAGAHTTSIVTNNDNAQALALYRSAGFVDRAREPFVGFTDHHTTDHWLFLQRQPAP